MLLQQPVEGAAFIQHGAVFPEATEPSERCTHGKESSSTIRCHFLNPASGCYLGIRAAGSRLREQGLCTARHTHSGSGGSHLAARCLRQLVGQRRLVRRGQGRFSCTAKGENCSESQ